MNNLIKTFLFILFPVEILYCFLFHDTTLFLEVSSLVSVGCSSWHKPKRQIFYKLIVCGLGPLLLLPLWGRQCTPAWVSVWAPAWLPGCTTVEEQCRKTHQEPAPGSPPEHLNCTPSPGAVSPPAGRCTAEARARSHSPPRTPPPAPAQHTCTPAHLSPAHLLTLRVPHLARPCPRGAGGPDNSI